jgi:hypothetical protein
VKNLLALSSCLYLSVHDMTVLELKVWVLFIVDIVTSKDLWRKFSLETKEQVHEKGVVTLIHSFVVNKTSATQE